MSELSADYYKGCVVAGAMAMLSVIAGAVWSAALGGPYGWPLAFGGIGGVLIYDVFELRKLRRRQG